jgi:hypothetical protein
MTGTVVTSLAAVAFFLLLLAGAKVGFGASAVPPRLRTALAGLAGVAFPLIVYVSVRLLDGAESLRPLDSSFEAHRRIGLTVTVASAGLGFTLFMGGILHLLFTSARSETFTVGELMAALRTGRWLRSGRWRRRVVIVAGVGLLTFGLFGLGVVAGPPGVKLLLIAALLYAAARSIAAARAG